MIKYYKTIKEFKKENSLEGDSTTKPSIFPVLIVGKINLALNGDYTQEKLVEMINLGLEILEENSKNTTANISHSVSPKTNSGIWDTDDSIISFPDLKFQ